MALLRLTLHHAKAYWPWVVAVLVLQLLATIAALWLPSLNAQIIDDGIAAGDVAFIWRTGGLMLAISFAQLAAAVLAVFCG
ncbi:MAG: ABC transporter ATP-binding protein, partial [Leucobacter sp.]|nr:ABC transporter ATP-binding protein [Leucobacter sp.]